MTPTRPFTKVESVSGANKGSEGKKQPNVTLESGESISCDHGRLDSIHIYLRELVHRASHALVDWVGLTLTLSVPLSAQFCLG